MDPDALFDEALSAGTDQRIALLTEALRLDHTSIRCWIALGDAYRDHYVPDQSAEYAAAEHTPRPESVEQIQDEMCASLEQARQAPAGPEETLRSAADLQRLIAERRRPADAARARETYLKAAEAVPASPLPHLRLAEMDWSGDRQAALAHLERAMALDPENALAFYLASLLHFQAGAPEPARECLAAARGCKELRYPALFPSRPLPVLQATHAFATQMGHDMRLAPRLRDLALQIAGQVSRLRETGDPADQDAARALLEDGRLLAKRVMQAHPRSMISQLVGIAIHKMVAKAGGPDAADHDMNGRLDAALEGIRNYTQGLPAAMMQGLVEYGFTEPTAPWQEEDEAVSRILAESGLAEEGNR